MDITFYDGNLLIWLQERLQAEWLTPVMKVITLFGEAGVFWIALCLLLIILRKTRRLGIICALSLAFSFLCCNVVIKPLVDRARPWEVFEAVITMLPDPGDASFPSGHTTNAIAPAWAMFLASAPVRSLGGSGEKTTYLDVPCLGWKGVGAPPLIIHRIAVCMVILAALIGLSRLYLGMHYPTDVLCGFLIGMICAKIVCITIRSFESRYGLIGRIEEYQKWEA